MRSMGRIPTKNLNLPKGMRAREQKSGKVYYYFDLGGKPRKELPLGDDYAIAVKKWAELSENKLPESAQVTFRMVWEQYAKNNMLDLSVNTQKDYVKCSRQLLKFFDNPPAPLDSIRPVHIVQYLEWRKDAKVRANHERRLFNLLWNMARSWDYTTLANPCTGIDGYVEKSRDIYIEDDVYNAVYQEADQPLKDALDLAYLTAQRPADVTKMAETDIKDGILFVTQNKRDAKLRIAIKGELDMLIKRILKRKSLYKVRSLALIVSETGKALSQRAIWERFDKARKQAVLANPKLKADIEAYQIRDLRAKGGTDKAIDSDDMRQAQKLLGHSSVTMTERYVRRKRGEKVEPTK